MNTRYHRLVAFLRLVAGILWWGLLVMIPLYALLALLAATVAGFPIAHVPLTAGVWIAPGEGAWVLEGAGERLAQLYGASARFSLQQAPGVEAVGFIVLWTLHKLALLPILGHVRILLRGFADGSPFRPESARHLRHLGVWILVTAAVRLGLEIAIATYAAHTFGGGDPELRVAPYFGGSLLLLGLAVLALAEIFRHGWELEDEQAWTV